MYKYYQPNQKDLKDEYGDCVIRAMTKATKKTWLEVFDELIPYSRESQCPYNCSPVWKAYLEAQGFKYVGITNKKGTTRPTVQSFAKKNKTGIFILRVAHHLVCLENGDWFDTWNSGDRKMYGYYTR
jgi:hypothetical protein